MKKHSHLTIVLKGDSSQKAPKKTKTEQPDEAKPTKE
jgi:hypothetical protein